MSEPQVEQREELLKILYYDLDSCGSFGGAKRLFNVAKQFDPSIDYKFVKKWLTRQAIYTIFRTRRKTNQRLAVLVESMNNGKLI